VRVAAMPLLIAARARRRSIRGDELGIGEVTIPPDRIQTCANCANPASAAVTDRARTPML
jgi:oligo-1,6-glucosidase/alpha-glucosidase